MPRTNEYNQPIGEPVLNWSSCPEPDARELIGRRCRLEKLNAAKHADELYSAYCQAGDDRNWTYLTGGPFHSIEAYREYAKEFEQSKDPHFYAVIDLKSNKPVGILALMRINPVHGVIEIGHVNFSPLLQRSPLSTEAQYLLMAYVFDELGYRRLEWTCDSHNEPSRKAAARLGYTFEGILRDHMVYKGRNRDNAWHSIVAKEWPTLKKSFEAWLSPDNFDENDQQRRSLRDFRQS